ncbi:hypothetical protein J4474_01130 [Candidatus Pacearchaeota archaeon]|nr:hypothetical protein [Candidatus Pacearchaeota archaeon]
MTENFLWHKVSDEEIGKIRLQAKKIMDNFSEKLNSADLGEDILAEVKPNLFRQEKKSESGKCDAEFRKKIFANAPEKNEDFILAERGNWK